MSGLLEERLLRSFQDHAFGFARYAADRESLWVSDQHSDEVREAVLPPRFLTSRT